MILNRLLYFHLSRNVGNSLTDTPFYRLRRNIQQLAAGSFVFIFKVISRPLAGGVLSWAHECEW
jgi:hypothetical protein